MRRRHFLTLPAAAIAGRAQTGDVRVPLRFFTEEEARCIAAAAARIFPADATGAGASEAGVAIYIDRQLASVYGKDRYRYTQAPFENGVPEQGYQGKATPREIYREGLKMLAGFDALPADGQDARLREIERSAFFALLRRHVIEGMFCDPMHGGNRGKVGWEMIGFPGPRMSYAEEVDQYHGRALRLKPVGIEEVLGRKVTPSEDEAE
jgi:gluconate 2-dehydrogenase gamma chain